MDGERDGAVTALAKIIYETLERMDPDLEPTPPWDSPEVDRALYENCIHDMAARPWLLRQLLIRITQIAPGIDATTAKLRLEP